MGEQNGRKRLALGSALRRHWRAITAIGVTTLVVVAAAVVLAGGDEDSDAEDGAENAKRLFDAIAAKADSSWRASGRCDGIPLGKDMVLENEGGGASAKCFVRFETDLFVEGPAAVENTWVVTIHDDGCFRANSLDLRHEGDALIYPYANELPFLTMRNCFQWVGEEPSAELAEKEEAEDESTETLSTSSEAVSCPEPTTLGHWNNNVSEISAEGLSCEEAEEELLQMVNARRLDRIPGWSCEIANTGYESGQTRCTSPDGSESITFSSGA